MKLCPCGFAGFELGLWSARWHQAHRDHHLSVYPDVDQGTRVNLAAAIEQAESS